MDLSEIPGCHCRTYVGITFKYLGARLVTCIPWWRTWHRAGRLAWRRTWHRAWRLAWRRTWLCTCISNLIESFHANALILLEIANGIGLALLFARRYALASIGSCSKVDHAGLMFTDWRADRTALSFDKSFGFAFASCHHLCRKGVQVSLAAKGYFRQETAIRVTDRSTNVHMSWLRCQRVW